MPSLFLSYNLIRSSYFNDRVRDFVTEEMSFPNTQILSRAVTNTRDHKEVKVVLIGETVPDELIANARQKLAKYGLEEVNLVVQQGFGQETTDINELKSLLMQDLYKNSEEVLRAQTAQIDSLRKEVDRYKGDRKWAAALMPEMQVLFPAVEQLSCANALLMRAGQAKPDTVMLVYLKSKEKVKEAEHAKMVEWLSARIGKQNIKLIIE